MRCTEYRGPILDLECEAYPPARLIKYKANCTVNMNGTERRLGLVNLIAESRCQRI